MSNITKIILFMVLVVGMVSVYVTADPQDPSGPDSINITSKSKFNASQHAAKLIRAEAGNLTELDIHGISPTQSWQGYYGDITGTITLDDAFNNTMYDWYIAEPQGEIYASNSSSVTWSNISCLNYTDADGSETINLTELEAGYGIADDDPDGVNETFDVDGTIRSGAAHPTVYVGTHTISTGTCPATNTYKNDSATTDNIDFVEILLTDKNNIIFTSIIENDITGNNTDVYGFDSEKHDFQMLVLEDGHNGDDQTTNYYFFVEIE